ncbi:pyridoxal phosphate-dependent transferase [Astrocystis sublimbata]|nr:pyridoxal phosphate-dependent transferase [Astrocystis sublimbata]
MVTGHSMSTSRERAESRKMHKRSHDNITPSPTTKMSRSTSAAASASASSSGTKEKKKKEKKSINLLRGWPATELLPAEALRAASQTALTDPEIWAPGLEYAPDHGYLPLREALAGWLGTFYGDVKPKAPMRIGDDEGDDELPEQASSLEACMKSPEQEAKGEVEEANEIERITITGGASQSLACILQSFTDPSRTLAIWIVAPCYFLACPIFADAGFGSRMHAVPEDEEGVDLEALQMGMVRFEWAALNNRVQSSSQQQQQPGQWPSPLVAEREGGSSDRRYKNPAPHRKIYRHVVYCVPAFANPSGRTMTLERRKALLGLARRYDALVICDDVYDMLQWQVEAPPSKSTSERKTPGVTATGHDFHKALLPRIVDIDLALGRSKHDPPGKHFGHVVSNGSFSKLVAPGTRTGWTYSTSDFALGLSQTGSTRSGGAASQLAATIVCQLLLPHKSGKADRGGEGNKSRVGRKDSIGDDWEDVGKDEEETDVKMEDGDNNEEEEEVGTCQLDTHIRKTLLPSYARRHALLMRAIRRELVPLGVQLLKGSIAGHEEIYGGYFVWLTMPGKKPGELTVPDSSTIIAGTAMTKRPWPTAQTVAARCKADEDLMIGNGELFAVHGDAFMRFENAIRLCFAWEDEEALVDGVERLGRVLGKMLDEGPEKWGRTGSGMLEVVDQAK